MIIGFKDKETSLRINNQYRLCFRVKEINSFYDIELVDYH